MKKSFLIICLVIFSTISGLAWWAWNDMQKQLNTKINLDAPMRYTIDSGMSLSAVLDDLHTKRILFHPHYLILEAKIQGKDDAIKAGEYEILPETTPLELMEQFISGKVLQHALIIVEGWTFNQMMEVINNDENLVQTLNNLDSTEIMSALGKPGLHPEGRFFPDTYHFPKGTTDKEFLQRAMDNLNRVLAQEWANKDKNLPYHSADEALVMASIIEKETGAAEERNLIAGVFIRRLQKGMLLQTDPTVIYAMAEKFDGNIRRKDLKIDSPYNTYIYKGLPPTPIALAGYDAIHAALHPNTTSNALFFVAKGDGTHYFSETLQEHNRAVAKYQLGKDE